MFRAPDLNERALGLVQGEIAGITPKRIPDLLDEPKSLADRQAGNVDGWICHTNESVVIRAGTQLCKRRRLGDV